MDSYEVFKTIHVLAAIAWVGGGILVQLMVTRMQRAGEHDRLGALSIDLEVYAKILFIPATVVVLLAGIGMVVVSGWNFTDLWILLGLGGITFTGLTGSLFLGPEVGRLGNLIQERGPSDQEVQRRMARIFLVSRVDLAVLILIVINMVVKPGA